MNDKTIISEIGQTLWSIMPSKAKTIHLETQLFEDFSQSGVFWKTRWGRTKEFDFNTYPDEAVFRVEDLLKRLKKAEPYVSEPFTHAQVSLNSASQISLKFAYIDEANSWTNLFMQGVSDITLPEATELGISAEHWKACVARFGVNA